MQGYVKLSGSWLKDGRRTTTTTTTARGNNFIVITQSNCKTGVIETNSPSLGQHYRLIVEFKTTLDCSFGWRLTFLLFPYPRAFDSKTRTAETDWGKYSTWPTSTSFEMRTACWPEDSVTAEDATLAAPNYRSEVSRASFWRTTTTSNALCKSETTAAYPSRHMTAHGSYTEFSQTLPATFTALSNIEIPLSVRKSRWVNRGSRTKLCTQQTAESIARLSTVTRSRFIWNRGISSARPRWNYAVNRKT